MDRRDAAAQPSYGGAVATQRTDPGRRDPLDVVFAAMPLSGHLHPTLPLALACRDAGHRVRVATGPARRAQVESLGFELVPVTPTTEAAVPVARERFADLLAQPEPRTAFIAAFFGSQIAPAVVDELAPVLAADRPDLVVHEFYDGGAGAAAAAAGVPAACHGLNRLGPPEMLTDLDARLAEVADRSGAPVGAGNILLGDAYLDPCPPSMQDAAALGAASAVWPVRPAPWTVGAPLPADLEAPRRRPRVYVTLGTVVNTGERALRTFRAVLDGLATLPVEVVVTVGPDGDPAALGPVGAAVRVERYLPQAALLEHVDLVVHHCGAGTMFGAAAAGLPQLGIPLSTDQFISGAPALRASGVGLVLTGDDVAPTPISEAVARLLEDSTVASRAAEVAAEVAQLPDAAARSQSWRTSSRLVSTADESGAADDFTQRGSHRRSARVGLHCHRTDPGSSPNGNSVRDGCSVVLRPRHIVVTRHRCVDRPFQDDAGS